MMEQIHCHMDIKTYLHDFFLFCFVFFEYIRNLKTINIVIEYVKYPPTSIDDIKDKKLKVHLKSIPTLIDEIKDKKISEFEESVRKFSNDKNDKLANLLLKRHFLIKAVQEVNKKLIEKKKKYLELILVMMYVFSSIIKPNFIGKKKRIIMMMELFLNFVQTKITIF